MQILRFLPMPPHLDWMRHKICFNVLTRERKLGPLLIKKITHSLQERGRSTLFYSVLHREPEHVHRTARQKITHSLQPWKKSTFLVRSTQPSLICITYASQHRKLTDSLQPERESNFSFCSTQPSLSPWTYSPFVRRQRSCQSQARQRTTWLQTVRYLSMSPNLDEMLV